MDRYMIVLSQFSGCWAYEEFSQLNSEQQCAVYELFLGDRKG